LPGENGPPAESNLPAEHRPPGESGLPAENRLPAEADLVAELAREERSERWLFIRQVGIAFVLVALLVTHALLG
jgi:hypothetical protein